MKVLTNDEYRCLRFLPRSDEGLSYEGCMTADEALIVDQLIVDGLAWERDDFPNEDYTLCFLTERGSIAIRAHDAFKAFDVATLQV